MLEISGFYKELGKEKKKQDEMDLKIKTTKRRGKKT